MKIYGTFTLSRQCSRFLFLNAYATNELIMDRLYKLLQRRKHRTIEDFKRDIVRFKGRQQLKRLVDLGLDIPLAIK